VNENTWKKVREHIREKIAPQSFSTWFEPLNLLALTESTAILKVPNQFHYDWIKDKYSGIIEACFSDVLGHDMRVEYSIVLDDGTKTPTAPPTFTETKKTVQEQNLNPIQFPTNLNSDYQFDNFVEGPGNQFASAAARAIVDSSDKNLYNPLVFYSGVGLGKTHLLHAIGNLYQKVHPRHKVYYVASDKFVRDFVAAIQTKTSAKFTQFYQGIDLLIVDDIQWFQGKERTIEEFFNIFNELYLLGKRIILATDRPPTELNLPNRLKSRFSAGLIVDIQKPDFETRLAILRQKSEESGIEISYDVMEYLSLNIDTNIRELQGALIRLLAYSSLV
jgi:chromosomal replication initiator protein